MKMLMIIFRESLEQEVCGMLKELDVRAFTEVTNVGGAAEAGTALHSFTWPGGNTMILTALAEDHADRVVESLRAFRDQRPPQRSAAKIPLRVFVLPCLEMV